MNEWEVKYKALCSAIDDRTLIDNAERMTRACIQLAATSPHTLEECYWVMARLIEANRPSLFKGASWDRREKHLKPRSTEC